MILVHVARAHTQSNSGYEDNGGRSVESQD